MNNLTGFTTEPPENYETMDVATRGMVCVWEGLQYMGLGGTQELTDTTPEGLTEDDLVGTSASELVPDDEEEEVEEAEPENKPTLDNLEVGF